MMPFAVRGYMFSIISACLLQLVFVGGQLRVPFLPNELSPGVQKAIPACPAIDPFAYMRDTNNCGMFYRCFWGKAVPMSGCTPGLVFSNLLNICVHPGSVWDDCPSKGQAPVLTPGERCLRGEKVFAHPDECHWFYNCSKPRTRFPINGQQLIDECRYPKLFDNGTLQCEDFRNVTCGTRKERKDACEYKHNQCPVAHCRPCWARIPSCVNASDGIHYDRIRMWSDTYVECLQERSASVKHCEPLNTVPQLFSPDLLKCVSIYDVPRDVGGLKPNCVGKGDQLHPEENGRCEIYIQCTNQTYSGYGKCPGGQNFDFVSQSCKLPSEICPPCGSKQSRCIV